MLFVIGAPLEHQYGAPSPPIGASSPTAVAVSGDPEDDGEIRSQAVSCDGRRATSPLRRTTDLGVRMEQLRGAAMAASKAHLLQRRSAGRGVAGRQQVGDHE
ncbi:hypothetical protein ACLOJK_029817 [Asimina triloba]